MPESEAASGRNAGKTPSAPSEENGMSRIETAFSVLCIPKFGGNMITERTPIRNDGRRAGKRLRQRQPRVNFRRQRDGFALPCDGQFCEKHVRLLFAKQAVEAVQHAVRDAREQNERQCGNVKIHRAVCEQNAVYRQKIRRSRQKPRKRRAKQKTAKKRLLKAASSALAQTPPRTAQAIPTAPAETKQPPAARAAGQKAQTPRRARKRAKAFFP